MGERGQRCPVNTEIHATRPGMSQARCLLWSRQTYTDEHEEVESMVRAIDVGQWLLDDGENRALHMQKLPYFAQVWSLVWTGQRLIDEEFQAWPKGPVNWDLYRDFTYNRVGSQLPGADSSRLDATATSVIQAVVEHYGPMVGDVLVDVSHDSSWEHARDGLAPHARSNTELDLSLAVREYTRRSILGLDVPARPSGLPPRVVGPRVTLREAERQDMRWAAVHARLAEA